MGFEIKDSILIKYHDEKGIKSVTIPNGVTTIGDYVFYDCSSLESITIPNSVVSIGESAFSSCSKIKSIIIPDSVTSIGENAFSSCSSLESITISENITKIGKYDFSYCSSLKSITIPDKVVSIEEFAFLRCPNLKSVSIPETLTDISKYAFNDCSPDLKIIKRKTDSEKEERNYCLGEKVNVEPNYKELFIKAFYAKELSDKENIFAKVNDESIKIPFAVFLFTEFESQTACNYISENSQKVLHYLVDKNNIEVMSKILPILNQKQ